MPLVSYALVTVGDAKTFLGLSGSGHDELITQLINQATDYIERKCQRRFASTAYSQEEYDGTGTVELVLKQFPVVSFTSLERNQVPDNTDSWETVDADDYWVENASGIITKTSKFYKGTRNYRVSYTAGYSTIPYDLQFACCLLVGEVFNARKGMGLRSESLGDHSVVFEATGQANPRLNEILSLYRKPSLAPAY